MNSAPTNPTITMHCITNMGHWSDMAGSYQIQKLFFYRFKNAKGPGRCRDWCGWMFDGPGGQKAPASFLFRMSSHSVLFEKLNSATAYAWSAREVTAAKYTCVRFFFPRASHSYE